MDVSKKSSEIGGGFASNLLTLGVPIGLSIAANKLNSGSIKNKSEKSKKLVKSNDQDGGFLEDSIILEAGLSVVPFGLIGVLEYFNSNKEAKKDSKEKQSLKK